MGPGPSNVSRSVLEAMSRPLVGHLDPAFVNMMEEIKTMLRQVFLTKNEMTFPVSGTGSAGMEFCFVNLIEPGDEVIIGVNGVFGTRMVDVAERCGAKVTKVEAPWGRIIEPQQIADDLKKNGGYIPGVRPGQATSEYLHNAMSRITLAGAIFLTVIAVIPIVLYNQMNIPYPVAQFFGGTSMLIVVQRLSYMTASASGSAPASSSSLATSTALGGVRCRTPSTPLAPM